jgi:hypothetical protein
MCSLWHLERSLEDTGGTDGGPAHHEPQDDKDEKEGDDKLHLYY